MSGRPFWLSCNHEEESMKKFRVRLAVARGACLNVGRILYMTVFAAGPLDAAITAETLADMSLGEREYSHATKVTFVPWGEAASLAAA